MESIKTDNKEKKTNVESLQEQIDALAKELEYHDPGSNEAKAICENIRTLSEAQANLLNAKSKTKLSKDTLVNGAISLLGIVGLGSLEKIMILPNKATSLVMDFIKRLNGGRK